MKINELTPAPYSKTPAKRVGRGTSSGLGKTCGKGQKGQNSRSGGGVRPGFEGGQMPLLRRLPKVGFTNKFRKEYTTINVEELNRFEDETVVDYEALVGAGLVSKAKTAGLKVLGNGELSKKLHVRANKFSESAIEKIKNAGGTIEVL
jgi:large subunit ribosomal protein L15